MATGQLEPQIEEEPQRPRRNLLMASLAWLWNRYSPHGEFPISSAASFAFHLFILALIPLFAYAVATRENKPPTVDVVVVGEEPTAAAGEGDGLPMESEGLESSEPPSETTPSQPVEAEKVKETDQFKPAETNVPTKTAAASDAAEKARDAARAAKESVQRVKDRINKNMNKGSGTGGGGGPGPTGRAARPARWVLKFNTSSPKDYLAQLEGLGANVAFPAQGDKWRYFAEPSSNPGKSEMKDLDNDSRISWIDENTYQAAANTLGVGGAPFMLVFLPESLEEKMLRLELAYGNLEEEDIEYTHFVVERRGGGYDIRVIAQKAK
jgi:hypothetical protein